MSEQLLYRRLAQEARRQRVRVDLYAVLTGLACVTLFVVLFAAIARQM